MKHSKKFWGFSGKMVVAKRKDEASDQMHVEVLTLSTSKAAAMEKGRDEDISGKIIEKELVRRGYLANRTILPDEKDMISKKIKEMLSNPKIDAIVTTGGTGVTSRDITVDVMRGFFNKEISGYGELLRQIGYKDVGGAALLSRMTAGIANQKPIFCLPGSPDAVKLYIGVILSDLPYVIKQIHK